MKTEFEKAFEILAYDFPIYAEANLKIVNKAGKLVPLVLNRMQRVLWSIYKQDRENGRPIRWYIAKSRQQGSSVFVLGLGYWRTTMNQHHTSLVLNYDDSSARNLGGRVERFYQNSKPILQPKVRKMNREEIHFATPLAEFEKTKEVGLDSRMIFSTADSENLGRSYTYNTVILSEFSLWEENGIPVDDRMISLNPAISEEPDSMVVIETTPKGEGAAKDFWFDEDNGFRKIFISWIADDTYRTEITEQEFAELELSEDKDSKYGNEVHERELIIEQLRFWFPEKAEDLRWLDRESACRIVWRRSVISKKLRGNKEAFDSEYPTTPEKMFSGSSASIFGGFKVNELANRIASNNLKPERFDFDENLSITDPYRKFYSAPYGKLMVYEEPNPRATYVIGGDAAQGVPNGDESCLIVLRVPEFVEVAMFSAVIRPDLFAHVAHYLSALYNNALLGIEINDKGGYAALNVLQHQLRTLRLYRRPGAVQDQAGWITNGPNRTIMINDFQQMVDDDTIVIRSAKLVDQMSTFVTHPNGKIAAKNGKKDDLVLAMMIAIQMAQIVQLPSQDNKPAVERFSYEWFKQRNAFRDNQSVTSFGFNIK